VSAASVGAQPGASLQLLDEAQALGAGKADTPRQSAALSGLAQSGRCADHGVMCAAVVSPAVLVTQLSCCNGGKNSLSV